MVIGPFDLNALEVAIQLKERHGGKITVLTLGSADAQDGLRRALAMGADAAVLIDDADVVAVEPSVTARALAAAIRRLDGVDLVRALQAGRQGTQGGSTKFEELTGSLEVAGGRYQYRNLRLAAGILTANGNLDIAPDQDISGRLYVELRSQAQHLRNTLNITGTLRAAVLRP